MTVALRTEDWSLDLGPTIHFYNTISEIASAIVKGKENKKYPQMMNFIDLGDDSQDDATIKAIQKEAATLLDKYGSQFSEHTLWVLQSLKEMQTPEGTGYDSETDESEYEIIEEEEYPEQPLPE